MTTRSNIRFKSVTSQQSVLFPSNLSDKIAVNHPVRIVNEIVDHLNIDDILSTYKGGGTSSYHPRVMIKILFYSYFNNIYSCRKIESQLKENIHYMWLSGEATPNFRTINDFRGKRLKGKIQTLFSDIVKLISEMGHISLDVQYIDGTKIESSANRYTFVWRKTVERNKDKLEHKIDCILEDIEQAIGSDLRDYQGDLDYKPINSKQLSDKIDELNRKQEQLSKQHKKQLKKLETDALPRMQKYEDHLETLGDRNSYSKTDKDATFMRMKEDHMKNGQLKPAYNIQISTENQFVTNFSIHQRPGDPATLIPHMEQFEELYSKQSKTVVADSGYGSEQNYQYLEDKKVEAFVKYNYFHKEQKKSFKKNPFLVNNLFYNKSDDYFVCPMGQHMVHIGEAKRKSDLNYEYKVSIYQAQNCNGCPMRGQCHKSHYNRKIEVNHNLVRLRKNARERLMSDQGLYHRSMRPIEPEAVFGHIKSNNKFNRFTLRGFDKILIEYGLVAISHNLRKIATIISNCERNYALFNVFGHFSWKTGKNIKNVNHKIGKITSLELAA